MNRKSFKWCAGSLMAAMLLSIPSCSDDHFTIDSEVSGRPTLWQAIESNESLSEYASILRDLQYSKKVSSVTKQTYADMLNHEQTFTVWAPKNGTFNYDKWRALLDDGTRASAYRVETELVRNNMTRFTHLLNGNDSTNLVLFNNKTAMFNCEKGTIKGQAITTANIGTSNGVLHVIDGAVSYLPNLYEYLTTTPGCDSIAEFILKFEKDDFNDEASTQGPTIDGNITWVDSVSTAYNEFVLGYMNARLDNEDSTYVLVIPSNEAWDVAYAKYIKYYNYMPTYIQEVTTNEGTTTTTSTITTNFTDIELDSIVRVRTGGAIAANLAFNANSQFGHKIEDFTTPGACDSLMNTVRNVFYDPESVELFDNATPVRASNGYAYMVNNYNFTPLQTILNKRRYEAENCWTSYDTSKSGLPNDHYDINKNYTFTFDDGEGNITEIDTLIRERVVNVVPASRVSNPTINFKIDNTLSCKYDIYVIFAPNIDAAKPNQFRATLLYHDNAATGKVNTLTLDVPEGVEGTGSKFRTRLPRIDENGEFQFNDSVLIAKDIELPICYYGVDDAYVTLRIAASVTSRELSEFTNEMLIDKIVLVPKEHEEE